MGLGFLFEKKILARFRRKSTFALASIFMKTRWFFKSLFQIKNLKNSMDLLLITNENKIKQKIKTKNTFARITYSALVVKMC